MRRAALAALALMIDASLSGCSEPPPKAPAVVVAPPEPPPPPPVVRRTPSKELAARFPYAANEEVTSLVYSDLAPFARPEVVRETAAPLAMLASELAGVDRPCVDAITSGARELLVGAGARGWVLVVRIPERELDKLCSPVARTGQAVTIPGTTKAWTFAEGGRTCATTPGWLACGTTELVQQALAANGEPSVPVGLEGEEILVLDDRDPARDLRITMSALADRFVTRAELTYDDEDEARRLHETFSHSAEIAAGVKATSKASPEQQRLVDRLTAGLVASHRGRSASLRIDLPSSATEQPGDLASIAGILSTGVLLQRNEARREGARAQVRHIQEHIGKAWEVKAANGPYQAHTRLVSLPAVPATVPRGERMQSAAEGWKAWAPLGYALVSPTFYQYEVKATKDGQSCDVIARGDLNGDGKPSVFTAHVWIDKTSKQLMVDDKIEESDPDE